MDRILDDASKKYTLHDTSLCEIAELARIISEELEYSEENTEALTY